jgi:prepilin-type N-terminal cleavage/methylation domain-containing protein
MKRPSPSPGFTLMELLVTITIIGAIAAIAFPATDRIMHKSRATHCMGNLRSLGTALQLYLNDHGNLMPTLVIARESKESEEDAIDSLTTPRTGRSSAAKPT